MAQQLANGKQQFIDGSGNPLAAGSVSFYQPGTLTPATTYQDPGLTVPNANPIVLDAMGMATIWGIDGTLYRQVVKDALGNPIWDQITGTTFSAVPTFVQLASSAGASLVSFIQSGASAVLRTIQAKLRGTVDAEDFGAVADGITDCYAAIMAAFAANPDGLVNLGAGIYIVSAVIDKPAGASLRGKGRGVTRLKMMNGANAPAVLRTAGFSALTGTMSTGGEFNSEVRDLTIDGNKAYNIAGNGIQFYGKYFNIENVAVENCIGYGIYTEYAGADNFSTPAGTLESTLQTVYVQQCSGTGIYLKGPHDMTLEHVTSWANGGWGIEVVTSLHVIDVNTYLNTNGGVYVYNSYGSIDYYGSIYGSGLVGSTGTGIGCYLQSGGNTLSSSLFGGPIALQIEANNNIVQGQVANSTTYGVLMNGASAQAVLDLTMFNNTGTIFGVSTASLKSLVRAFMGDSSGILQNGAFPGTWQINGYTGFAGAIQQLYGTTTFLGGRVCLPNLNYGQQTTQGMFYDTSAPASGSFNKGDRVFNSNPAIGSPKSWVCTVSGTPGTWISEGNL